MLAKRAEGISQNLHRALETHNRYANDDITTALIEHARSSIMYERQLLRELEALRVDVNNAAKKVVPATNGAPKPTVVPPLEEFGENPHPLPRPTTAPVSNGFQQYSPHTHSPPLTSQSGPSTHRPPNQAYSQGPLTFASQSSAQTQEPLSASSTQSSVTSPAGPYSPSPSHISPQPGIPPQSPGAGPSTNYNVRTSTPVNGPPLGGRFVDGSKSMFVNPTQPPHPVPIPTSGSSSFNAGPQYHSRLSSPLYSDPLNRPTADPLNDTPTRMMNEPAMLGNGVDPLGHIKPSQMSSSMRVQPTRPRLDAREAASKLANMF